MLNIIGLGVKDLNNVTIRGLKIVKDCSKVYLINSGIYSFTNNELESLIGKPILCIDKEDFYKIHKELILSSEDVGVLVAGDPFNGKIFSKCQEFAQSEGKEIKVVHNASLLNWLSCSGLQLYRFGESVCIYSNLVESSKVTEFIKKINTNLEKDLHTFIYFDDGTNSCAFNQLTKVLLDAFHSSKIKDINTIIAIKKKDEILRLSLQDLCKLDGEEILCFAVCASLHPIEEESLNKLIKAPTSNSEKDENANTFHLIGLGLGQPSDVTLAGKEAIAKSKNIFLESYTSIMIGGKEELEAYFEKQIEVSDREMVEQNTDIIFDKFREGDVAFLVVGDPLGATTHTDLLLRAAEAGFNRNILNNASIINAVGVCGLNPDHFGEVVSIPFWDDVFKPESFYDKICCNLRTGLHTLCLLDIKVKEQSIENLLKGRKIYEPPRFMSVQTAAEQLLKIIENRIKEPSDLALKDTVDVIGLARVGTKEQAIKYSKLRDMSQMDLGGPLHSLVIVGPLSQSEKQLCSLVK